MTKSEYEQLEGIQVKILSELDTINEDLVKEKIHRFIMAEETLSLDEKKIYMNILTNSILKYDIIQPFLDDDAISEIMINGLAPIYIEKKGQLIRTNECFATYEHLMKWVQKVATEVGREVNFGNPTMDARLVDGSRVNVILDPIALNGPAITIRKFISTFNSPEELIQTGALTPSLCHFLKTCISHRFNILIAGGTGSGKTTLLNCLTSYINKNERVIVIEDASEINLSHLENVVSLETRNANKHHVIPMSQLIKNALRMRPDRIIVGEVRGEEAIDMLQAMNTGHDGSITTGHSNSNIDMLVRLEVISSSYTDIDYSLIRRQIISAVDLIVYIERVANGVRKVTQVDEVLKGESDYKLNNIYDVLESTVNTCDGYLKKLIHTQKLKRYHNEKA